MKRYSVLALIKGYVVLTRPLASVLVGLAILTGQTVALKRLPDFSMLFFPALASVSLTAASFVLNDYLDLEIDRINKPDKPLPSGLVSRKAALLWGLALTALGFTFGFSTNFLAYLVLVFAYFLSIFYSLYLKARGILGNIAVAICVSASFMFGALSATGSIDSATLVLFSLCFFSNLGREITQSITDLEGDKKEGLRTISIVYGNRFAAILGSFFYALMLILGPVAFLYIFSNLKVSILTVPIIMVPEFGFVSSAISLVNDPSKENVEKNLKYINLWMFLVLIATAFAVTL